MPTKPKTPCKHPGCPNLVPSGTMYCDEHKALHPESVRSASGRGYGRAWQRERRRFLAAHPLCEECLKQGRYTKATDVDHVIAHRGDADLFWDVGNWRALCHACHSKKTSREDMYPVYEFQK